ncbi:hypothetical protein QO011_007857 [Labrys wisconsinensis]|uniref:Uncharacterized protein n=1 Tax=Labrys wisconsinensis TaxID=425677 RepID=A0ABU0JKK6_9HYPH|nr:hypothetical protein [Labrys wisconsinensis]
MKAGWARMTSAAEDTAATLTVAVARDTRAKAA